MAKSQDVLYHSMPIDGVKSDARPPVGLWYSMGESWPTRGIDVAIPQCSKTPNGYERYRALVCGHPPQFRERRAVALIKAFLDDSGTHDGARIMCIGGCIAPIDRWDRFSYEWSEHLISWDLDWFHMTDAENRQGAYKDWTNEHRDSRVGILSRLVARTIASSLGVVLDMDAMNEELLNTIRESEPGMANTEGDPYYHAFHHVFNALDVICEQAKLDKSDVEIVFAEQRGIGPRSVESWREYVQLKGYPEPVFRSPQKLVPLQAADMIAWFLNHQFRQSEPQRVRPRHQALTHNLIYSPIGKEIAKKLSGEFKVLQRVVDEEYGPRS